MVNARGDAPGTYSRGSARHGAANAAHVDAPGFAVFRDGENHADFIEHAYWGDAVFNNGEARIDLSGENADAMVEYLTRFGFDRVDAANFVAEEVPEEVSPEAPVVEDEVSEEVDSDEHGPALNVEAEVVESDTEEEPASEEEVVSVEEVPSDEPDATLPDTEDVSEEVVEEVPVEVLPEFISDDGETESVEPLEEVSEEEVHVDTEATPEVVEAEADKVKSAPKRRGRRSN